jgi:CRISPR-associated endonuclease/helicase Cas3
LGLSGKVVIFDEVHAYDAYMNTLFKRLLAWLRELNASVIVLSATLPESTRRELAAAYLGQEANDDFALPAADYPRLTFAPKGGAPQVVSLRLPDDEDKPLVVQWLEGDQATLIETLRAELNRADSVCVAMICNRVDRAQEIFAVLQAEFSSEVTLFHARTPFIWRKEREAEVLGKFGPPDNKTVKRPRKAIVVATQVIEQSLDLDFDVMLTDHAPIDLLLQRAGRLHRHDRPRQGLPRRLFILKPESNDNELPNFGKDKYVYARYTLLATWFALRGKSEILLPKETSLLIEQVYGNAPIAALTADEQAAMADALKAMKKKIADDEREANTKLVLSPDKDDFMTGSGQGLDEDNPELHAAFKALTRKDAPGVQVVCLHETPNGWRADPDDPTTQVDPYAKLTSKQIELLLRATMDMRRYDVKKALLDMKPPEAWKKFPALRYHRLLVFRQDGINDEVPTCQLRLTRELGLQFTPRKEAAPNPFDYDDD